MLMKKINICFLGINPHNNPLVIKIYDKGKLIYNCKEKVNKISLCLKENKKYKLDACFYGFKLQRNFFVGSSCNYIFAFQNSYYKPIQSNITLYLKDYYYNLPIERGEMTFG